MSALWFLCVFVAVPFTFAQCPIKAADDLKKIPGLDYSKIESKRDRLVY